MTRRLLRWIIRNAPKGLASRILGIFSLLTFFRGELDQFFRTKPLARLEVLIIAPGIQRIPVEGWGAVERLTFQHYEHLKLTTDSVGLLNSSRIKTWLTVFLRQRPRVVVCHYDALAPIVRIFSQAVGARTIGTSHYAYAPMPLRWDLAFRSYWSALGKFDVFVALSSEIAETALKSKFRGRVEVIPNGADANNYFFDGSIGHGSICLGKVEKRKRQFELANSNFSSPDITYVGPLDDDRIQTLPQEKMYQFVGPKSAGWVFENLTSFSSLILASDAEADALVIHEALIAGLRVFATKSASGSFSTFTATGVFELRDDFSNLPSLLAMPYDSVIKSQIRLSALESSDLSLSLKLWSKLVDNQLTRWKLS